MDSIPPGDALAQLARLLEGLQGEAILRLEQPGAEHRWRLAAVSRSPEQRPTRRLPAGSEDGLRQVERNILVAADAAGCELTGPQLAERAGYPCSPRFRAALSRLRRMELLSGEHGAAGYEITEAGRQLLHGGAGDDVS